MGDDGRMEGTETTDRDITFVEKALEHYRIFAEASERRGDSRTAGVFRKQEFYAERFLTRLRGAPPHGPARATPDTQEGEDG